MPKRSYAVAAVAALSLAVLGAAVRAADPAATSSDPFLWLEQVDGPRAMAWVRAENARTLGVLERDPAYPALEADALAIAQAKDRIPEPTIVGGAVFNFWQDANHVRGIWRETTVAGYASADPAWTTVLDLDAVAKSENANWVWRGADCVRPAQTRCLITLSDGGEDAETIREFDRTTQRFVADGFTLPRGKQGAAWEDADTLLVSRAWAASELTTSGYPYVVKRLRRGMPLDAAVEVFRGAPGDQLGTYPTLLEDGAGHRHVLIFRGVTFFEHQYDLVTPSGTKPLAVPADADIQGLLDDRLIVLLKKPWTTAGATFPEGALVSIDFPAAAADPAHLAPVLIAAPGPREAIQTVSITKTRLLVASLVNVRGHAAVYAPLDGGGWAKRDLAFPENVSLSVRDTDLDDDSAYVERTGFLTPPAIVRADAATGELTTVKSSPARFDASRDVVDQDEAVSADGTRVPYFVVHPKTMKTDGANPTILTAYGGFQISETPTYSGSVGKLWLERGGVFVLANIRGGGEFGPSWHEAGLKTHRQRIYDDFTAVARDLIARRITSPRRLGIEGGSNGGLLMGVAFTQHPELFHAVDIAVPLLDMVRFEQIAAGASWVGEYGTVAIPEERAFLASISPYAHLEPGVAYPEPFIWTTTKDDRVGPQHARKFAAKLASLGDPFLFYEVTEGGHGSGANLRESAKTTALQYDYFIRKLMN